MTRGVVLWPDKGTSQRIGAIWESLARCGLPSMATETHRLHRPHVSLIVATNLEVQETLEDVGEIPSSPIRLLVESAGLVPGGHLLLTVTANADLLLEQQRVHTATLAHAYQPRPHYLPGRWLPHLTMARALRPSQFAQAIPIITSELPIEGTLVAGGVEDGTTGDRWAGPT